jgi:hypothetical protein
MRRLPSRSEHMQLYVINDLFINDLFNNDCVPVYHALISLCVCVSVCAFRSLSRVLQLPSVYETMKTPSSFSKMIIYTFSIVLVFYLPLAVVGYWAYGDTIQSPIYDSLCDISNPDSCSVVGKSGVYTAILAVSIHVLMSYAIVLNPTELEVCHSMPMTCNVQ